VLPRHLRLTRPEDFRRTIRSGRKAVTDAVVVHGLVDSGLVAQERGGAQSPRIGVTVNKAVGGSVVRHRVARQIRHAVAERAEELPLGSTWVFRALPAAAQGASVASDVHQGIDKILGASAP
jgi:ribonuclease P protein component